MVNDQALLADLVAAINKWLEGNRGRSLSSLARRTNVAYSTIRRIAQNESVPHPYTALSISEIVLPSEERLEFLKKHFPAFGTVVEECFAKKVVYGPQDEMLTRLLQADPYNRIFNIAATSKGTTREAIGNLCGRLGLEALDYMIELELLVLHPDGTIKYHQDGWAQINVDEVLNQVRLSTQHVEKSLMGTEGAAAMHLTGSIRPELLPKVKEMIIKFSKELSILKNDPSSEGEVHFFCDLIYSLYDSSEYKPTKQAPTQ